MKKLLCILAFAFTAAAMAHGPLLPPDPWALMVISPTGK